MTAAAAPVLDVRNLVVEVRARGVRFPAVDDMNLAIHAGETVALVGESGCGKSMFALSVMRLLPDAARIVAGAILVGGQDVAVLPERALQRIRGKDVAMVFQEPMTALNPVIPVGRQIAEAIRAHQALSQRAAHDRAIELLDLVQLPNAARRAGEYPHELSGGMRQRIVIAMALACDPKLLVADEPTTALDVTTQAEILALIRDLQQRLGVAMLLITHDLGVVAQTADRVAVMYAGRKMEEARVGDLFSAPRHPYTRGLISLAPRIAMTRADAEAHLAEIPGAVPSAGAARDGCLFAARCSFAMKRCRAEAPTLTTRALEHAAACWADDIRTEAALVR